jgi:hypothetical protein
MSGVTPVSGLSSGGKLQRTTTEHIINSESNLPNVSGGISTFEPNVNYKFANGITLDIDGIVLSEGTMVSGDGVFATPGVTFTTTGDVFTSTNVGVTFDNIAITAPNSNQVINCSGTATNSLFADKLRLYDCNKLGSFAGMAMVLNNFVANRFTDGFSFSGGPIVGFSVVNAFMQDEVGATFFDFDDAAFLQAAFRAVEMFGVAGSKYLSSSIGGANLILGTDAIVQDCTFGLFGEGTPLTGFTDGFQTVGWEFNGNSPASQIENSVATADSYLLTSNTVTVTQGVYNDIGVPVSGVFESDLDKRFTMGTDGALTYDGNKSLDVTITVISTVEKVGGGSEEIDQRIAINWDGTGVGIAKSTAVTQNNQPTQITSLIEVTLSPGDEVTRIFTNLGSNANVIVLTSNMIVTQAL